MQEGAAVWKRSLAMPGKVEAAMDLFSLVTLHHLAITWSKRGYFLGMGDAETVPLSSEMHWQAGGGLVVLRTAGSASYLQERGRCGAGSCCLLRENSFLRESPLL